jgi:putative tricarboxylic transport membrane protein
MTEDSPHTHIRRWPQLIFYGVLLTIVGTVLFDSFRHEDRLTTVYPWFSVAVALIFLIPIGIQMFLRQSPDATFYDSEREEFSNDLEYRSSEHYLLWLLGLLAGAALFGFVIGIALFMFTFVRMKAGLKFLPCALFAGIFVIFLGVLQDLMTLEYPMGLLQTWLEVQLPWPLQ